MKQGTKKITLDKTISTRLRDRIIENLILGDIILEAEDLTALKEANLKLANNSEYAVLAIVRPNAQISKKGRETLATETAAEKNIALAIVVSTIGQKKILEMYQLINKPQHKMKIFQGRDEGLEWLEQQIEFYESNSNFTGVLIDASQIGNFELATIPRIRNQKGDIIYPTADDLTQGRISSRPVSYDFDVNDAVRNARIAVKPFIILLPPLLPQKHFGGKPLGRLDSLCNVDS